MTGLQWILLFFVLIVSGVVAWLLYGAYSGAGGNSSKSTSVFGDKNLPPPKPTLFAGSFQSAIAMAQRSPKYIYVVEQLGKLWRVDVETGERIIVLDIGDTLQSQLGITSRGGERGLLGIAFSERLPDQAFVAYSAPPPAQRDEGNNERIDHVARLSQFTIRNAGQADERFVDERVLIDVPQETSVHHAQTIAFDPRTGYLYYSLGDGGPQKDPQNNAQNLQDLRGKLLRIAVSRDGTYSIPPENPFYEAPQKGAPEIIALGLRNPWRFSIDANNDRLFIGDVGFASQESIDMLPLADVAAGKEPINFGWNVYEGTDATDFPDAQLSTASHTGPIYQYQTGGDQGRSVIGGYALDTDNYLFADFVSGKLMTIANNNNEKKNNGKKNNAASWKLTNEWSPDQWLPQDERNDLGNNIKIPSLYQDLDGQLLLEIH